MFGPMVQAKQGVAPNWVLDHGPELAQGHQDQPCPKGYQSTHGDCPALGVSMK